MSLSSQKICLFLEPDIETDLPTMSASDGLEVLGADRLCVVRQPGRQTHSSAARRLVDPPGIDSRGDPEPGADDVRPG